MAMHAHAARETMIGDAGLRCKGFEAANTAVSAWHRMILAGALAIATPAMADVARTQDAQTLLTHFKCYICHADRETKAGPAFVDVAAAFRGTPNAVSVIALEIRRGLRRGGPWHMPPHPEVSQAQARTIARYIMSLKR